MKKHLFNFDSKVTAADVSLVAYVVKSRFVQHRENEPMKLVVIILLEQKLSTCCWGLTYLTLT